MLYLRRNFQYDELIHSLVNELKLLESIFKHLTQKNSEFLQF